MRIRCFLRATLTVFIGWSARPALAQPAAAGHQPDDVPAVLAAMDRYLAAISSNDLRTMESMLSPEGTTYTARPMEDGTWRVRTRPNLYWVTPSQDDGHAYRERYWQPTVLVRGPMAVVWAPYEFWKDGETTHCGIDVFSFVKAEGQWWVANAMWTVEPGACAELRPADPAQLRPREAPAPAG